MKVQHVTGLLLPLNERPIQAEVSLQDLFAWHLTAEAQAKAVGAAFVEEDDGPSAEDLLVCALPPQPDVSCIASRLMSRVQTAHTHAHAHAHTFPFLGHQVMSTSSSKMCLVEVRNLACQGPSRQKHKKNFQVDHILSTMLSQVYDVSSVTGTAASYLTARFGGCCADRAQLAAR